MTPADLVGLSESDVQKMILCELHALRTLVTAALAPLAGEPPPPAEPACEHPPQGRLDHSAMGQPRFSHYLCTTCGQWIKDGQVVEDAAVLR
jgi:hypothetical protein